MPLKACASVAICPMTYISRRMGRAVTPATQVTNGRMPASITIATCNPLVLTVYTANSGASHVMNRGWMWRALSLDSIVKTVRSTGALAYTTRKANEAAEKAINALNEIPDSNYKNALIDLARFAVQRNY